MFFFHFSFCKACPLVVNPVAKISQMPLTLLQEFLEYVLQQPPFADMVVLDRRWVLILLVAQSINRAMRNLYRSGAWLHSSDASPLAHSGLTSCRAYRRLADLSLELAEPRFPMHPKFHMLVHTFRFMQLDAARVEWQESPLCDSCQMDEGFVGQLARYSRRVSPKTTAHRTLDLYLTSLWRLWGQEAVEN
jgi:hypothetical protein